METLNISPACSVDLVKKTLAHKLHVTPKKACEEQNQSREQQSEIPENLHLPLMWFEKRDGTC